MKIWDLAIQYYFNKNEWENGPFLKLNASYIDKKLVSYLAITNMILKKFELENKLKAVEIVKCLKNDLEDFKNISWLINYLTIEVMIKR